MFSVGFFSAEVFSKHFFNIYKCVVRLLKKNVYLKGGDSQKNNTDGPILETFVYVNG